MSLKSIDSVFITGANRGIGLEFTKQLATSQNPPKFVFASHRRQNIQQLQELSLHYSNVILIALDVTDDAQINKAVDEIKLRVKDNGLNLLINNAGICYRATLNTITEEILLQHYRVNTLGPLMIAKSCRPLLQQASAIHGISAIVNISSSLGTFSMDVTGGIYAYRCSKAALNMITKCLSEDLAADKIAVVALRPGWVQTDLGGYGADLTVTESVRELLKQIKQLHLCQTGQLICYTGAVLDW
ncbi:uncharacterized protein TRIADDRAFT_23818 [Trichoplax adhaerens]|uniref:C-factor n=1 Tax=Trichoplax adhaerens TaxID=10228 RepID=B3RUM5_TRIAD|nr:hypothetical protein TRIADDRAFT_23818 [Trichoplax adhaerens]EDV25352.1 hypothetical protein TRIADDRAFT_23818 [Trichoplax adhaerens]|eukprot:XP_002111385.1 hypothetical protein TRIADDRAFT_23818 [Trichoplax adhaerens]